jgi:hypothetical protein
MEVIGIALYTDMCGWVPDKWFYPKNADCFFVGGGITYTVDENRNGSLDRQSYRHLSPVSK